MRAGKGPAKGKYVVYTDKLELFENHGVGSLADMQVDWGQEQPMRDKFKDVLTKQEMEVIIGLYVRRSTWDEIAHSIGSHTRDHKLVQRIQTKALAKLKLYYMDLRGE